MINIGFYTPTIALSCNLPDVHIFTDCDFVDFRLAPVGGLPLLEGRYYVLNGVATVTDIASLVENFFVGSTDTPTCEFEIEASTPTDRATKTFNVLPCYVDLGMGDLSDWLTENFLTLVPIKRIAPDSFISVLWYTTERESASFRVYCTFLNDKGQRGTYHYVHSGNGMIAHINGVMSEFIMLNEVTERVKSAMKIDSLTLQSVTVRCGNRSATYFIDPSLSGLTPFWYTNCFNVPEQLLLPRVTTEKVKSDRSVAILGRFAQFYDISTAKEYEVQSGPLTYDECMQVEQMLTSQNVRVPWGEYSSPTETDFEAMHQILITDFTSELSDSDEKPNSVKFTWRYADNRQKVNAPTTPGIFNNKFQPTFS